VIGGGRRAARGRADVARDLGARALLIVCLVAAGCGRTKTARKPAPATDASALSLGPAGSVSAKNEAEPPSDPRPSFEVELEGVIRTPVQLKAVRYVAIVTPEECTLDNLASVPTLAIGEGRPRPTVRKFWTEGNVREGTRAWVCVFGLDANGAVSGFGSYPQNPLTLRGGGKNEIEIEDLDVTLSPVRPPRSLGERTF
jgi:hypothetical protein